MVQEIRGLRKGAWAKEEDALLRKCIEVYGEGKWHLVPDRAGLNRCRKSCRLRWLNYLRPDINRSCFTGDEVDLLLRLHKLLGNRWSLIAGRLPGRTANDVKNFWNSHVQKKLSTGSGSGSKILSSIKKHKTTVIRPRPVRLSYRQEPRTCTLGEDHVVPVEVPIVKEPQIPEVPQREEVENESLSWWSKLLEMTENGDGNPIDGYPKTPVGMLTEIDLGMFSSTFEDI